MRSHRLQPIRLPRPWHSPGKNTGVGCHFLLQCMKVESESEVAQSCPTLFQVGRLGVSMEEIGCKCQTFFSLSLKWQEETKYKRQSFGFPDGSVDKESACNAGDPSSIPGSGRSPGEGKATHTSILAWRIPWSVWSMGSQRVGH